MDVERPLELGRHRPERPEVGALEAEHTREQHDHAAPCRPADALVRCG